MKTKMPYMINSEVIPIGEAAIKGMLLEASATPAPGLVDRKNSGAHNDMDFNTFMLSSAALSFPMFQFAQLGFDHPQEAQKLLSHIREIGITAENNMFTATQGINTQKGLLFVMSLVTTAAGMLVRCRRPFFANHICDLVSKISAGIVKNELEILKTKVICRNLSAGERVYLEYGLTGIRGEVESGLPSILFCGLPLFKEGLKKGLAINDALVHALIGIMCRVQDTTVISRHDPDVLYQVVQIKAQDALAKGGMLTEAGRQAIVTMDQLFTNNNISPGGAADLLATTAAIYEIERKYGFISLEEQEGNELKVLA